MTRVLLVALLALACVVAVSATASRSYGVVGEGKVCTVGTGKGTCTAGACPGGYKVSGRCPGSAAVTCCMKGTKPDDLGNARKSLTSGAFPYSFPYSTARHIVADVKKQRIRLYDGSTMVKEWKMSSGAKGVSFTPNSHGSPSGRMKIIGKYGAGAPLGMQFESLKAIGKIGYPTDAKAHVQTRVLQLAGMDKENANTQARSIYIHGTNADMQLGWQASHGCFRMRDSEVVELFNLVTVGTEYYVHPNGAWPN